MTSLRHTAEKIISYFFDEAVSEVFVSESARWNEVYKLPSENLKKLEKYRCLSVASSIFFVPS